MTDHTQHSPARAKGPFAESTLCKLLNARMLELAQEKNYVVDKPRKVM